uniref:transporter associated domain-containing protein n=1 Tax=Clavibacter michiganensis TaxID=28447 RepID=UPI0029311F00
MPPGTIGVAVVLGASNDEYETVSAARALAEDGGTGDGRLNFQDFEAATCGKLTACASATGAGFVIENLGRLAQVGDTVEVDGVTLQVTG